MHWTPVIWGVILQFVLGLLILRWPVGYSVVQFLGDQVGAFLAYSDKGSIFVFGEQGLKDHPVVFQVGLLLVKSRPKMTKAEFKTLHRKIN